MLFKRNRTTTTKNIYYALHLYFSGLSLIKKSITTAALVSLYKKEPCIHLELDSALQARKVIPYDKENLLIYS
jgi:hypothetical protein